MHLLGLVLGEVDLEGPASVLLAVHALNRRAGRVGRVKGDEAEATGAARLAVTGDEAVGDVAD